MKNHRVLPHTSLFLEQAGTVTLYFEFQKRDLRNDTASAMAMYMNHVPVYTIMLLGRWSSNAFLRYIRSQVKTFGHNVSKKMINTEMFYHVPNLDFNNPRTHNPQAATFTSGMGSNGPTHLTAFAVWVQTVVG
jgi:hypothetical protein